MDKINEQAIHKYIISLLEDKFLKLGTGFACLQWLKLKQENFNIMIYLNYSFM